MTAATVAGVENATTDGGARVLDADLWCSYAAIRTLRWLEESPADPDGAADFLAARQNPDGGFAWQRGLPSDIWATHYCTQALSDLGRPVPHRDLLASWLPRLRERDGGFGMAPGLPADVWATYYATKTYVLLEARVPDVPGLASWLAACQVDGSGLGWAPGSTQPDVRAGYYGALAWRSAAGDATPPVHRAGLVGWLRERQAADGGIAFAPGAQPCAWAAFRGVRALAALDAAPADPPALRRWLRARRLPGGGYERWTGYGQTDVWACFSVIGALQTLGSPAPDEVAGVADVLRGFQLPGSGFTYREPRHAGDSLATAAALLGLPPGDPAARSLVDWLRAAQMPYEDGVMYMPGRGAEIRCTLWAASALRAHGAHLDTDRLRRWLREMQNVDGGFGYWHGRGSDLVSTVSALELAASAGLDAAGAMRADTVGRFVRAAAPGNGALTPVAQHARALALVGDRKAGAALAARLTDWASSLGGFAATARGLPDLVSTYQAVLTQQAFGLAPDRSGLRRFLAKVRTGAGYSWSPLSREPAGPLAARLGTLLSDLADGATGPLPALNL